MQKYLKQTNLYEEARRRRDELLDARKVIEKRVQKYPPGSIHIVKTEKRIQFYIRTEPIDRTGKYISKKEGPRIRTFLQKRYDEATLKQLDREIANLERFLHNSDSFVDNIRSIYSMESPEVKGYVRPLDLSDDDYIAEWLADPYVPKAMPDGITTYRTEQGEVVRSKSELNIANALYRNHIPYKYECPLVLSNGTLIYPDFTTLDVKTRHVRYWEHRGMMDDKEYARMAVLRNRAYVKEGYALGEDLIITEETQSHPLGTDDIMATIRRHY